MISASALFVVTRPAPGHERLMQALAQNGRIAIHSPGFRLESEPEAQLERLSKGLAKFDLAIVTSPTTARLVAAHAIPGEVASVRFMTPGAGTGSILEAAGIPATWPETGGTSEDILGLVGDDIAPGRVAIVGAPGGRGLLAREFSRRGARVDPVHLYRRVPVAPNPELVEALRRGLALVNLVSSLQAFETILSGLPARRRSAWLAAAFVLSSARLARLVRDAGVQRVRIAKGASDEAMLAAALQGGAD